MPRALSQSPAVRRLMEGPARRGVALGHGHVDFAGYVVSLTRPGAGRMPNGIECSTRVGPGAAVIIGGGVLCAGGVELTIGPDWSPLPSCRAVRRQAPGPAPDAASLAGLGPGLTPAGDDLIVGYVAGLQLLHGRSEQAAALAEAAARRTTSLSATLLRHAARGELPEAAHEYLDRGLEAGLLAWGQTSGRMLLAGLRLAGARRASRSEERPGVVAGQPKKVVARASGPPGREGAGQPALSPPALQPQP
jgi:hypothetical protein